jgi:hypothetical protein
VPALPAANRQFRFDITRFFAAHLQASKSPISLPPYPLTQGLVSMNDLDLPLFSFAPLFTANAFPANMSDPVTLRTRKFIRNPLLGRKQMVVYV